MWSDLAYHRQTTVRYRVDNAAIEQGTWFATPNSEAFGTVSGSAVALLKRLAAGDHDQPIRMYLEARGMSGNDGTFIFDITGIKDAIAPLAKARGW